MKVKITTTLLHDTPRPASGVLRIMDTETPGFGAEHGVGRTSFFIRAQIDGKRKWEKIGVFPTITVHQARSIARHRLAELARGVLVSDPKLDRTETLTVSVSPAGSVRAPRARGAVAARAEKRVAGLARAVPTLKQSLDEYIEYRGVVGKTLKESTKAEYRSRLGQHLHDWMVRPFNSLTRSEVRERHVELTESSGPYSANRVMAYLSGVLNWANENYTLDDEAPLMARNPVTSMRKMRQWNREGRRQTFIDRKGMPGVWAAIESVPDRQSLYKQHAEVGVDFFKFLAFTGMRPGEAQRILTSGVDLERELFVLHDAKNRRDFFLPFSRQTAEILARRLEYARLGGSRYVFPSSGRKANTGEDAKCEWLDPKSHVYNVKEVLPTFMMSDFRRTMTTVATNLGYPTMMVKRLMNHVATNESDDVTDGYYATDVDWLREPLQRICDVIEAMALAGREVAQ